MKSILDKRVAKIKTQILCSKFFFLSKHRANYELVCKNMVLPEKPQILIRIYGAYPLYAGKLRLQTHTQNM